MSHFVKLFKAVFRPERSVESIPLEPVTAATRANDLSVATNTLDIAKVDASRRLNLFSRSHRWDPNIGDNDLADIRDATALHDASAEAKMVDRVIENSPYPEVRPLYLIANSNNQFS